LLEDPTLGRVWLIEDHGSVAGYLALCFGYSIEFGGRDAFVDELYLLESRRGRGLGKAALEAAAREAATLGVVALHLEVGTENAKARKLYESVGFLPREGFALLSRPTALKE
jgi:GNAT superfamily N-acetyltransferase